ncbi:hypothetical protein CC86DRAFT_408924 [Ophiobolus disseminans]|uniref:Uncharacterized protein n=1 Tax=Ophiobolus disseminans TaxID=1469910 RepID=A0A6A6ZUB2_9PLEO|nr:hypothetical protein CC86DRAFT_408924 [Ophiobolus disseminans]
MADIVCPAATLTLTGGTLQTAPHAQHLSFPTPSIPAIIIHAPYSSATPPGLRAMGVVHSFADFVAEFIDTSFPACLAAQLKSSAGYGPRGTSGMEFDAGGGNIVHRSYAKGRFMHARRKRVV